MRYQIMSEKENAPGSGFTPFFETEDFEEAKAFAMRLAFDGQYRVFVFDQKVGDKIWDFEDPRYRD